ncbi:MAG: hypothetical protein RI556_04165 [Hydrogenovibrio sp.]|uniref:P-loop ATPase, Sll1717 family n=1 Tax=Hydrogenovibrio sp. TaxID=2065821 RepID=UPI00287020A2|nr:hypothetical protein [Hydrogenovibrio sp.]MDR9498348.1 hypothetical protein [Hydrogenovibrio sp.]
MEFGEFYKNLGLKEYPFQTYTAENESEKLDQLFVIPPCYDPLLESYKRLSTLIIDGERGTGKTFLVNRITSKSSLDELKIIIDDFSELKTTPSTSEFHVLLMENIVEVMFEKLAIDRKRIKRLNEEQKILLSYLLSKYVSNISKAKLRSDIEKIQVGMIKRYGSWFYNKIRGVLNYGTTATSLVVSDLVSKHFHSLPPVDEGKIKVFFPEVNVGCKTDFLDQKESFVFFERVLLLIKSLGFKRLVVVLDKLDEDERFHNDAQRIADFVEPLLTDSKLLLHDNIQLIVSIWSVPYRFLKSKFRTQKHDTHTIQWSSEKLINVLNSRLKAYSDGEVSDVNQLFEPESELNINDIVLLSNNNPRDLWHVMDSILKEQYDVNPKSKLTSHAVEHGITRFVKNFNFYEYYPRKSNARANTMDIYSYIAHLQKMDSYRFSKNKLNEQAGTGGSTDNYVTNMEKIGLIKKTGEKASGGVEYIIDDPKVIYAINNGIKIQA